jgi:hypothetical protein
MTTGGKMGNLVILMPFQLNSSKLSPVTEFWPGTARRELDWQVKVGTAQGAEIALPVGVEP